MEQNNLYYMLILLLLRQHRGEAATQTFRLGLSQCHRDLEEPVKCGAVVVVVGLRCTIGAQPIVNIFRMATFQNGNMLPSVQLTQTTYC